MQQVRTVRRRCLIVRFQRFTLSVLFLLCAPSELFPQTDLYSLTARGSFTTSSKLFYNIESPSEFLRNQYFALDDVFGVGFDVRRSFAQSRLQVGLSVEYLSARETFSAAVPSGTVPAVNGYWAVPIEVSGYFLIPFSTADLRFYIGGGIGVYLGERRYSIADESAAIVSTKPGAGIHVATGVEYSLREWLSLRSEVKFRDLQFESTHRFDKSYVVYNGMVVALDQTPTRSRVNIDGMMLDVGIVFKF